MSSHHIIRDEQEPPVLVFQLNENWQELSELLGWSPVLLIDPLLKEFFELRKTKIDGYILNDKSKIEFTVNDIHYQENLLGKYLLNWISIKNYTAINIFCDNHLMLNLFSSFKGVRLPIPFIFFTEEGKFILKPNSIYKKWYPSGFMLNVLNADVIKTQNLEQGAGSYRVKKDGFISIEVEGDFILLNERSN
ncbi:hypothetical protein ABWH96_02430 [Marivirga tractuosa]|uniref:hypothetical protein n=1 Tax=Marivirga tractuosa TaxID=1006 RepID=UPI0035CFB98A